MRYYISDCHFFHGELNDKMDCRGFGSTEEMNAYMLKKWNAKVRPNDEVVILGDLSWGKPDETKELLNRLNGKTSSFGQLAVNCYRDLGQSFAACDAA